MRWRDLSVLLFLLNVLAGSSLLGQQSNGSLGLRGERHTPDWDITTSFRLGSISLFSGDSRVGVIIPDSGKTRSKIEGMKGDDVYKGYSLYSQVFRLGSSLPSLRIPVQYHVTLTSMRTSARKALAAVFLDILDAERDTVVARLIGHGIEGEGGVSTDSAYSEELLVSGGLAGGDPMWTISGKEMGDVSLADLCGRNLRVRLTVFTDPVMIVSGVQFEAGGVGGLKSLE